MWLSGHQKQPAKWQPHETCVHFLISAVNLSRNLGKCTNKLTSKSFMLWLHTWDYVMLFYQHREKCHITKLMPPPLFLIVTHICQFPAHPAASHWAPTSSTTPRCAGTVQDLDPPPEQTDGFTISTASNSAGSAESYALLRRWVTGRETDWILLVDIWASKLTAVQKWRGVVLVLS